MAVGRQTRYADAYTAALVGESTQGMRRFMSATRAWHRWLAVEGEGRPIARAVTGWSNAVFLFIVASGFYLWCPRKWTWQRVKPVVLFGGRLRGKARDFNWHNVIGLWSAVPLFIVVLTAMPISFPWANALVYRAVGEEPPRQDGRGGGGARDGGTAAEPPSLAGLDALWSVAERQVPGWRTIDLRIPASPRAPVVFAIDKGDGGQPQHRSTLTLDRTSAAVVSYEAFSDQSLGRRLRSISRFAHTGEVLGLPGQTVAGLVTAGVVVLVWTGIALTLRRFRGWLARRGRRQETVEARDASAASPREPSRRSHEESHAYVHAPLSQSPPSPRHVSVFVLGAAFMASTVVTGKPSTTLYAQGTLRDARIVTSRPLGSSIIGSVDEGQAQATRTVTFNIPGGTIGAVADQFRTLTGIRVVFANDQIRSLPSPGVTGTMTAEQALERLLGGTGVGYVFTARDLITMDIRTSEFVSVSGREATTVSSPKYTTPLRDVPQTIALIPRATIEEQGATTLSETLRNVSGITLQAGEGGGASNTAGDMFNMRGFNASNSLFVDGVRDDGLVSRDVFNLEQVEVFMGPTGSEHRPRHGRRLRQHVDQGAAPGFLELGIGVLWRRQRARATVDLPDHPSAVQLSARVSHPPAPLGACVAARLWAFGFGLWSPGRVLGSPHPVGRALRLDPPSVEKIAIFAALPISKKLIVTPVSH